MKIVKWLLNNFLFSFTIFLLAFIPLYPKLPLLDVVNTWVYVRAEDFIVFMSVIIWVIMLILKKVSLRTPLTIPILIFWIVGGLSTLHGVLLIFPTIADVFSNVALLSFFRRIEYMFLFFVAFTSIKDKKFLPFTLYTLAVILILISLYGFGQKFLGFPAYLTMNEEFAKGVPIQLSQLSRVPSTFAGHYDLAAYLVLVIPILVSVIFVFKNWLTRIFLGVSVVLGFALLFMTVSRVSFIVLLFSLVMLLFLQKKKFLILALFVITFLFLIFFPSLASRFGNTLKEVTVLVDVKTGAAMGQIREVDREYFKDKVIKRQFVTLDQAKLASGSAILPFALIPPKPIILMEPNVPTGENLPQGTGYINLPLSPVLRREAEFYFEKSNDSPPQQEEVRVFYGDYVVKKAYAYDLSFTTRFQGEWPKTIAAFKRNIFIGSGYASVTLAVDNNYLRILGESGLLGFFAFLSIFLVAGIYILKILPKVDSPLARSFVLGFTAGTFGLMLNAIFIDVFEASKVAFTYWLLMGVALGVLYLYKNWNIDIYKEFIKAITSPIAVIIYIFILTFALYLPLSSYYFVGDDFTWFRWIADCHRGAIVADQSCNPTVFSLMRNFTESDGFFYRPGTKIYFTLMYSLFWLNQTVYHFASIILHFAVGTLIFFISRKILKNHFLSALSAFLFIALSGYHEAVFWISSTGFLFTAFFALLALLCFIYWGERGRKFYLAITFTSIALSMAFHELGIVVPLILIAYDRIFTEHSRSNKTYLYVLFPIIPYLVLRFIASSHWFNGDYSYNLLKLPYNFIGNSIGYIGLDLLGPIFLPLYNMLRAFSRSHISVAVIFSIILVIFLLATYKLIFNKIRGDEKKVVLFASLFFVIFLLPFLGLGNISSRYSYLSSFGVILIVIVVLRKMYPYLLTYGKNMAILIFVMIAIIFSSIQLFQLQKIHSEWQVAGEKSKKFLVSLNRIYTESAKRKPTQFYFVDVPIRNGEAWVFPVGLEDALWFIFQNDRLVVDTKVSLTQALERAMVTPNTRIFQFNPDDTIKEIDLAYPKEVKQ